ncbi:MAG: rhodanese-like domain-containing protein, partial [Campylobacterota bacterium]|nr:rhodanese-like domain-containing protein [Campylobacterota bacterium]
MKNLLLLFATLILLIGCSRVSDEDLRKAHTAYENGALIVDVRTVEEFKSRHIQNAINIPVQKLDKLYSSLPKDREIIVYCRSGSRSSMAAGYLRKKGRVVYDVA